MSGDPDEITILSSDTEDEVPSGSNAVKSNCHDEASTSKRRVPLQRVVTGKEVFSEFLEKCQSKEKSAEMDKIIKKLWKRFNEAAEVYTKSSSFKKLVQKCTDEIDSKLYSSMKMICDELQSNKKTQINSTSTDLLPSTSASTSSSSNNERLDPKTVLHIEKLERLLTQLNKRICQLESVEMNLNSSDEENSAYVQVDRFKDRFCKVFEKLCELKKKDPRAERTLWKNIKFSDEIVKKMPEVYRAIEKFYNDRREFPDYRDILSVVKKANDVKKLNLLPAEIDTYARNAFQELGKTLKKYRQLDDVEIFRSYLSNDEDPASNNQELENALKENLKNYGSRIDEVIDKYAVMQDEQRLEPTEVDSDVKDEEDSDEEEDPISDCESRSSILECKSDSEDSVDLDYEYYIDCKVVLTDVRFSPDWEKYVVQKQEAQSMKSDSNLDKYPTVVIEMCHAPERSRKRSHESDSDEDPPTEVIEPLPSTSRDFVPIILSNYRHIKRSKKEKPDEVTLHDASKTSVSVTLEKISIENDSDVIEIISDSCEKNITEGNDDDTVGMQEIDNNPNKSISVVHSKNIASSNNNDLSCSNNDDVRSVENSDEKLAETSSNNNENSGVSNKSPVSSELKETVHDDDHENSKCSSALHSISIIDEVAKSNSSIINDIIDIDMEDSQEKISKDTKNDALQDPKQQEIPNDLVQIQNHFMCNGDSMPAKNIDSDDVMVIDEIIKPKTPVKGNNEIIDIEEISDSVEKPKQVASKKVGQAINLSQMIRSMKFKPETIPKNTVPTASLSKQVTFPRSTSTQLRPSNMVQNNSPIFRQMTRSQNTASVNSRTVNGLANMMRPPANLFNNQRQTLNARQFASMQSQNVQYFSNNANVTMKSSQTAMQRKVTSRTVRTFHSTTNRMITRKEITTVVQQSVMQVVGQDRRMINRQVQQVSTQRISTNRRNNFSDDVITIE